MVLLYSDDIYEEPTMQGFETDYMDNVIRKDFIDVSGRHAGIFGMSGSGKTTLSYMIVSAFVDLKACIIWFDTGKSAEVLRLIDFCDIHFIIPHGYDIKIEYYKGYEHYIDHITKTYIDDSLEALSKIKPDKINVICIRPFYQKPEEAGTKTAEFMEALIEISKLYILPPDTVLFLDELQHIAPAKGYELNSQHKKAGNMLAHNIDQLRSWGVRVIGMGQDWSKVLKSVRSQFPVLFIKRGVFFYKDDPHLNKYNERWKVLDDDQFVYVTSRKIFTEPIKHPFYGDGNDIGRLMYLYNKQT